MAVSGPADFTARTLVGVLQAIVPALCMNVCIVGFNQVCDIEIDKARARQRVASASVPLTRGACAALMVMAGEQAVPAARIWRV
jgi:4-hydroxybenzoate polyprenyltransferase